MILSVVQKPNRAIAVQVSKPECDRPANEQFDCLNPQLQGTESEATVKSSKEAYATAPRLGLGPY